MGELREIFNGKIRDKNLPAIFRSRILRHMASAFRIDQFSILVEKLRKNRYSFNVTDILRAIFSFFRFLYLSYLINLVYENCRICLGTLS